MPYPVSTARLCLAPESSAALDDAVSVARRRQHAQTTSLHVVFALLSTSTSSSPLLRDALSRARSSACSQRLQFKALELCFGVALDRLPSSSSAAAASTASDEPPLANSLMAAIKRSQANQRRHPDTFHFYQQQMNSSPSSSSSSSSSFSGVKVELQQLILAILDDPIVSRVFGEAGFRSTEIKLAVLRPPPPPILQFPRAARRPLFLCNFSAGEDLDPVSLTPPPPRKLGFGFSFSDGGEENCRRIGEIMAGKCNRNPMLVGIGAADAARDFARAAERQSLGILPPEMSNLKFVNLEREIFDIKSRLEELGKLAEESKIVVGIGDLKELDCLGDDLLNCLVKEITRALEMKKGRFWVMGWSATYETYMKFLSRYPTLDKDWDLQLQLISSAARQPAVSRPPSLMESFVPFGGLFPTAYESNIPVMKQYSSVPRCQLCNDKYEEELATILKGCTPSCVDQNQGKLPLWLQSVDMVRMNNQLDVSKVKDDEKVLNVRAADLQKKWNDYCQRQHQAFPKPQANKGLSLPPIVSLPSVADKNRSNLSIMNSGITQIQSGFSSTIAVAVGLQKSSTAGNSISMPMVSGPTNKDLISKLQIGLSSHQSALTDWSTHDDRTSPSSVTSVTTDLVLGTVNEPSCAEELACRSPSKQLNEVREHRTPLPPKPCFSSSHMSQKLDPSNLKAFYNSLLAKVGRQDAAVFAVSQAITRCRGQARRRGASPRGDIWLSFIGQDMLAKKKAAKALAELMCGSKENMICIDLGYQESLTGQNSIFYRNEVSKSDVSLRGKTVDDRIAGQISKRPASVVFLENVEKADIVVQEKLKHAICTGKISDSHGREFSINNAIFVVTTSKIGGKTSSLSREIVNFSEEKILAAQRWQMKMSVEPISKMTSKRPNFNASFSWRQEYEKIQAASKRKLEISDCQRDQQQCSESPKRAHRISNAILDLNLPVEEEEEENDADCSSSSNSSGNEDPWLDEFLKLIDETVSFEPFNFDALSECIMKEIKKRFCSTISSECLMEIDKRAMEEILAASLLLEDLKDLNNWIENVLVKGFVELRRRHSNKLSTHSTVRLVALEETFAEEHAHGVLLPSRIILDLLTSVM